MNSAAQEYLIENYDKTSFVLKDFFDVQSCDDNESSTNEIEKIVSFWRNMKVIKTVKDESKKHVANLIYEDRFSRDDKIQPVEFGIKYATELSNALVESSSISLSLPLSNDTESISTDAGDGDISDDSYVEHTNTLSNSSDKFIAKKTKGYKDYLVSTNVSNTIDLNPNDNVWILPSGVNFSSMFITRRNDLIEQCQSKQVELQVDEELSVNGIILLDDDLTSNIVNESIYEEACSVAEAFYEKFKNTTDNSHDNCIYEFCTFITKKKFSDAEDHINNSTLPYHIKNILFSLKYTYSKCYSVDLLNESTVVKDTLVPFLDNYFPNTKKMTSFGADKEIPESRKRFKEMDPSLYEYVRKADFSIVSNSSSHLILALEAKSVKAQNKSGSDLIKMARYMKDTIDDIERDRFKTVSIIGILASGKDISTYIMTHAHDFLYCFCKVAKFYIPTDYHDMCRIIPIFPVLDQLKNIVTESSDILSTLPHERATEISLKNLKTYHTPTLIPEERIKRVNLNTDEARRARRRLQFD